MKLAEKRVALLDPRYPLAARYDPDWTLANAKGSPSLWLVEALARKMTLQPGMRVLDMGCGKAITSIFLAKEFGVQVWAVDLEESASDNWERIQAAALGHLVYPIQAEAHALPFAANFFDAIVVINAYQFFGTADTYFSDHFGVLARPGAQIGFALPGLYTEFADLVPEYLQEHWRPDFYYFHSFDWWQRHFRRCGSVAIECLDDFDGDGNRIMQQWESIADRMRLIRVDNGRNLSWIRLVVRKL